MTLETLLDICERYSEMGDSVTGQLKDVLDDFDKVDEQNPNALQIARTWLVDTRRQLDHDDASLRLEVTDLVDQLTDALHL